jgi:hypothetical protein
MGIVHKIVIDDSIPKKKYSTFIDPPLYVIVNFNTFIINYYFY